MMNTEQSIASILEWREREYQKVYMKLTQVYTQCCITFFLAIIRAPLEKCFTLNLRTIFFDLNLFDILILHDCDFMEMVFCFKNCPDHL